MHVLITHIHTSIHIYICVCVQVSIRYTQIQSCLAPVNFSLMCSSDQVFAYSNLNIYVLSNILSTLYL